MPVFSIFIFTFDICEYAVCKIYMSLDNVCVAKLICQRNVSAQNL